MTREIQNPRFINNARTVLEAEFVFPDGRISTAQISNPDGTNADWNEIMQKFSVDVIEANTKANIQKVADEQARKAEKMKTEANRKMQEDLFQLKLQAFEVPTIRNSKNSELKSAIRKSKTQFEVMAYSVALLLKEQGSTNA